MRRNLGVEQVLLSSRWASKKSKNRIAVGAGARVTNDGGDRWASITNMMTGMNITQTYSLCATPQDPDLLSYGTQDNGTYRLSLDGEVTLASGGDGGICLIDPRDSNIVYASYVYGELYRSDQGGVLQQILP